LFIGPTVEDLNSVIQILPVAPSIQIVGPRRDGPVRRRQEAPNTPARAESRVPIELVGAAARGRETRLDDGSRDAVLSGLTASAVIVIVREWE
jgi:hypothetical protein